MNRNLYELNDETLSSTDAELCHAMLEVWYDEVAWKPSFITNGIT